MPTWQPTAQEIEEKLIEMAYVWGDIEESLELRSMQPGVDDEPGFVSACIGEAFRVEAIFGENDFADPCSFYVLLFDVADPEARKAKRLLEEHGRLLAEEILERARPWHTQDFLILKAVPRSAPVEGQICRRLGEKHPRSIEPSLDDLPAARPPEAEVGFEKRDVYWLTPIEAKFYDAARDTGLSFAVQPWVQGTDRRYRPDFIFFYDGKPHVVELDGHEWHKTREQRSADATRERWFEERGIRIHRFTGSQIHADPQGCVSELLNLLRAAAVRP